MSQHIAQQAIGIRKEKFFATKEFHVTIEIAKDSKRSCHDRENSVTTKLIGKKGNVCPDKEKNVATDSIRIRT